MKRKDIQPCLGCGKGVLHDNALVFYRIKVEMLMADLNAIRREAGLEMMIGNVAIATVLSPDEDLAKPMPVEVNGLVCLECAIHFPLAALTEKN